MPSRAPKTDKWTARENNQKKSGIFLIVSGLVQVTDTSKTPGLTEAIAPGRKTKTLILDLSIEAGNGPGNDVLVWKRASYDKKVTANQYAGVDIHWNGKSIATCKVLDDGEHHQHLVKLTQAANAKFAKKSKTATAKPKVARPSKPKTAPPSQRKVATRSKSKAVAPSKRGAVRASKPKMAARVAGAGRARTARKAASKKKR